jgi:hypothetical protein
MSYPSALDNSRIRCWSGNTNPRQTNRALPPRLSRRRHARTEDRYACVGDGWVEWECVFCLSFPPSLLPSSFLPLPHRTEISN